MKAISVRLLSAFFALAAFAVAGRAQAIDQLIVNVPFQFVVAGTTLPAGAYRVNRVGENNIKALEIVGIDNRQGVFVVSNEVSDATEYKGALTFQFDGSQHLLSKIETGEHIFSIPFSIKSAPIVAKNQSNPSTSSSSGSN